MDPSIRRFGVGISLVAFAMLLTQLPARADDASAKLYASKCVGCHSADGSGSGPAGQALKVRDFHDPDVQKQSDADLTAIIAKGKNKMPSYEKAMKPEEIKGLVAYVRELGGKK